MVCILFFIEIIYFKKIIYNWFLSANSLIHFNMNYLYACVCERESFTMYFKFQFIKIINLVSYTIFLCEFSVRVIVCVCVLIVLLVKNKK